MRKIFGKNRNEARQLLYDDVLDICLELFSGRRGVSWIRQAATGHGQPLIPIRQHPCKVRYIEPGMIVEMDQNSLDCFTQFAVGIKTIKCRGGGRAIHRTHLGAG